MKLLPKVSRRKSMMNIKLTCEYLVNVLLTDDDICLLFVRVLYTFIAVQKFNASISQIIVCPF